MLRVICKSWSAISVLLVAGCGVASAGAASTPRQPVAASEVAVSVVATPVPAPPSLHPDPPNLPGASQWVLIPGSSASGEQTGGVDEQASVHVLSYSAGHGALIAVEVQEVSDSTPHGMFKSGPQYWRLSDGSGRVYLPLPSQVVTAHGYKPLPSVMLTGSETTQGWLLFAPAAAAGEIVQRNPDGSTIMQWPTVGALPTVQWILAGPSSASPGQAHP